jgi:hypothetical protein
VVGVIREIRESENWRNQRMKNKRWKRKAKRLKGNCTCDKYIVYFDPKVGSDICLNIFNFGIRDIEKAIKLGGSCE